MAEKITIEALAKEIVSYLTSKGLSLEEAETEIAVALSIIINSAGINLSSFNQTLKERNGKFVEFDIDSLSSLLSYIQARTNLKFRLGFLQ